MGKELGEAGRAFRLRVNLILREGRKESGSQFSRNFCKAVWETSSQNRSSEES